MKSTYGRGTRRLVDAPRVKQLRNVRYKSGSVKVADIRKAVNTVVKERLAAENPHATDAAD
jgi:hypothetical protein